ncbi:HD domain-containing phosphohydrolase [Paenibacillus sp. CN-4]|uniref:HD domain-containing phosphohydrolase n=1 Tax=Paenibacillus nanchangensis TaxID=3348343 RepID=UPI00397AABD3
MMINNEEDYERIEGAPGADEAIMAPGAEAEDETPLFAGEAEDETPLFAGAEAEGEALLFAGEAEDEALRFAEEEEEAGREAAEAWKVLVVDDHDEVHRVTRMVTADFSFQERPLSLLHAYSGEEAIRMVQLHPDLAVILLDVVMERDDSGLQVVRYIREELHNREVRIILRTGQPGEAPETRVITQYDINDYKEKTELTSQKLFTALIASLRNYRDLKTIQSLHEEIDQTQKEIIFTMGEIAETRSKETGNHVKRVAEYSKLLALRYGLSEEEAELIRLASPMHDVGKIAISDSILNKPGRLTSEEFEIMKTHSRIGYDMLKHSTRKIIKAAAVIALQHHEKYNGTGYPSGLRGEDIHLYGRITAVADVFDALASDRVYKKAWEPERIRALFREERGAHFDPELTDLFLAHFDEFWAIKEQYTDGVVF